jgi:hypothetical protein
VSVIDQIDAGNLPALLERAGFHIRGRRADCIHCEGSARLTVSFNDEVAHCHRCKWSANVRTLSRDLGLPLAPLTQEVRDRRDRDAKFSEWQNTVHLILVRRWRTLTRRAELAKAVLVQFPDCEPAWSALADFYDGEATFTAAFEFLACEKLPNYLENPMTRDRLRAAFDDVLAGVEIADAG